MIRLTEPTTGEEELAEVAAVLATGFLAQGTTTARFEERVAKRLGAKHAFAMSSGTTALHLSLVVLDIGPGDEVVVADFTFPASANVVVQQGARPVFVDIEPRYHTIDIDDLRRKITPRTRAIMPVHAFGCPADMKRVRAVADEHGLAVVEDAACAIGATCDGAPAGNLGTLGCLSFHARKVITTGEGGMILTDDDDLARRIALLRSHGGVREDYTMRFEAAGFNYRLSDVQAAIGLAQMDRLDAILERRRVHAERLVTLLADVPGIHLPADPPWGTHTFQTFVVRLDEASERDRVIHELREQGVESTIGTYALHLEPYFQRTLGYAPDDLPQARAVYEAALALPLFAHMSDADLERVASVFRTTLARART